MSEYTTNVDQVGLCPNCGTPGPTGEPCQEKVCARRGYHHIPPRYATNQLQRDTRQMDPLVGCVIGDYVVVDTIGVGGFGRVYLALQMPIRRRPLKVALKVIDFGDDASQDTIASMLVKFEAEADALATLSHPNIVRLMKYGQHENYPYIVMEYVAQGRTLYAEIFNRVAAGRGLLLRESAHIMRQVVNGIEEAHDQDIVHRDIKPDNIMLQQVAGDAFFVRLLDFGLAKFVDERQQTSMTVGTPMYMAPEQLDKSAIGPWTDIYAMGVMAFELFTGRRAFEGEFQDIYRQKLDHAYSPLWRASGLALPEPMADFFRTAMAVSPNERYQSCSQFRAAMDRAVGAQHSAGLQTVDIQLLVDEAFRPGTTAPGSEATTDREGLPTGLAGMNTVAAPPSHESAEAALASQDTIQPLMPVSTDTMRPGHQPPEALVTQPRGKTSVARATAGEVGEADTPPGDVELLKTGPGPVVRGLSLGFVLLAIGLFGALYFLSKTDAVLTSFQGYSGPAARAGEPTILRMSANSSDGQHNLPVSIKAVRVGGASAQYELTGESPAYVRVVIPNEVTGKVDVQVDASSNGVDKTLSTTLEVARPDPEEEPPKLPDHIQQQLQAGAEQHLTLLPDHQELIRSMDNRVFVRVRDMRGDPIADANVAIKNKALFPSGAYSATTDPNGLVMVPVHDASHPMYNFTLTARKGIAGYDLERRLVTNPRQMQLHVTPPVTPTSMQPTLQLRTWKPETHAYCELVLGDVVVWATYAHTEKGEATLRPPAQSPGRYDMQCYDHPASPGTAYASVPVIVSDKDPLSSVIAEVKRHKLPEGAAVDPPEGSDPKLAMGYWLSVLRRPLTPPRLVLDTRVADQEAHAREVHKRRVRILSALGALVLLFLLWVGDGILKTVIATRERLREFDDRDAPSPSRLIRIRGLLLILVLVGAVAATVLGVVWLIINVA